MVIFVVNETVMDRTEYFLTNLLPKIHAPFLVSGAINWLAGGNFMMLKKAICCLTDCHLQTPWQQTVIFVTNQTSMDETMYHFKMFCLITLRHFGYPGH